MVAGTLPGPIGPRLQKSVGEGEVGPQLDCVGGRVDVVERQGFLTVVWQRLGGCSLRAVGIVAAVCRQRWILGTGECKEAAEVEAVRGKIWRWS